ncbi:DUF4130 domain-containing protein [Methanococcoides orientis]|uniref:DUF4130 domain-containing protein n=1 Tax=Methanococcoides orientis TaxID=2822137 RepID=UPI001E3E3C5D|nr:DUF4130 domain-containing protein [Methanococcoides orientis]UGV40060.1 DUF4130 domain-containing protein [Methanococcoides orientis]
MIIAFSPTVDGVLLACSCFRDNPGAELVFAKDVPELDRKLSFSGSNEQVQRLGFTPCARIESLSKEIFGKRKARMARFDPNPKRYVDLLLRHKDCDPVELVQLIISCNGDTDQLYSGKGRLAKRYYNYMRDVSRAYERLCMFSRPEFKGGILSVVIDSPHDIGELFCGWLARKNPDVPVAVMVNSVAWVGNGDLIGLDRFAKITSAFIESLQSTSESDNIDDLWDVYYDSQMIESRRNIGLAKKVQPKFSASMSKMAKRDRYKVERGISSCRLDSFA